MASVTLKVMLSSVRRGLADVRDTVAPLVTVLDYVCIRFEDVTSEVIPPRAVCVRMVKDCDIYLLLLGESYGEPMPGTGLAPTEEEWTVARSLGRPTVVFKKEGITPEPLQAEFISKVEAYESGVWRDVFVDIPNLIRKLKPALAIAAASLQPVTMLPLTAAVSVPWRGSDHRSMSSAGGVLETHVIPIGGVTRLPASSLGDVGRQLARAAQDHGLFPEGQGWTHETTEDQVALRTQPDRGGGEAGISVTRDRSVSVWESLPRNFGFTVLDEDQLRARVARDLRVAAEARVLAGANVAVAIGIDRADMLAIPTGQDSMTVPFAGRDRPARLEPTDSVPLAALAVGADDIATELVARLLLRLNSRQ